MGDRRMLTKLVTDADEFIGLSASAQALYMHLTLSADDDGFTRQLNASMFKAHASVEDVKALLNNRFIIQFDSGVIVIKHWRMANALRKDRYKPTQYQDELSKLTIKENGAYTEKQKDGCQMVASWLPNGCQMVAVSKDKLSKDKLIEDTRAPVEAVPLNDGTEWLPTLTEYEEYKRLYASVNVANEFKKIRTWCLSNPAKRKTKNGIKRFVNAWLAREQDKPKRTDVLPSYMDTPPNEEQKQYTAEELERLING